MQKPILVILAAGMGSRYGGGGLKQIDPVGANGEIIMDFSVFDAIRAGFERVVYVIKKEMYDDFKAKIGDKVSKHIKVDYAFQDLYNLPEGFEFPEGRVKPWGTAHATLAAKDIIDAPFVVINADDYYGVQAYKMIYDFLTQENSSDKMQVAMVGYMIENTLSDNGHVARGVCELNDESYLTEINERTRIERVNGNPAFTQDDGETWTEIKEGTAVSMNFWGFPKEMMAEFEKGFVRFLENEMPKDPLKAEYFLPFLVDNVRAAGDATVKVIKCADKWYGVTYKPDKEIVVEAMKKLVKDGVYNSPLY